MSALKTMLRRKLHVVVNEISVVVNPENEIKKRKINNENDSLDLNDQSNHIPNLEQNITNPVNIYSERILQLARQLNVSLCKLTFKTPVEYIYNPVEYAYKPYASYVSKFCDAPKKILFVGMNPGPFGMCQTGVPFGEINHVRDWLNIKEEVLKPEKECPYRKVLGFDCSRSEESGKRLWGLFKKICETPETFFKHSFLYNYCPLALLNNKGTNVTPDDLKKFVNNKAAKEQLEILCNQMLYEVIQLLQTEIVIGVGRYAENRCKNILKEENPLGTRILFMPHPSPLAGSKEKWLEKAENFLTQHDLLKYFKPSN